LGKIEKKEDGTYSRNPINLSNSFMGNSLNTLAVVTGIFKRSSDIAFASDINESRIFEKS